MPMSDDPGGQRPDVRRQPNPKNNFLTERAEITEKGGKAVGVARCAIKSNLKEVFSREVGIICVNLWMKKV